jgi:protocatechuate 3,4-dioxygenase beta subunit
MAWHLVVWHWLAHAALGGTVVLAAACLALRGCRQPARRQRVIELALLGALAVPWLTLLPGVPHWSAGLLPAPADGLSPDAPQPGGPAAGGDASTPPAPAPSPPALVSNPEPGATPAPAPPPSAALAAEDGRPAVPAPAIPRTASFPSLPEAVVLAYAAAVALLLLRGLAGWALLRRLYRGSSPVPAGVAALFRGVAGPAGAGVRLLASRRLDLPLTFGWRRPVILLPEGLCRDGDEAALRYCLAHEWSHVERRDACAWYLATLAQLVFFYQPLFWWLRRQLRLSQDYLADARAAEQAAAAEDYAAYLVSLARRSLGAPVAAALGIGDRRSHLYRRILMLLHNRAPLQRRCFGAWNLAAVAAAVALVALVSAVRLDAGDPPKKQDKAPASKGVNATDPAKGEAVTYTGKVFDKDTNKPIAGATVTVRRSLYGDPTVKEDEQVIEEPKYKTDAEGKYTFTVPPEQAAKKYLYIELDVEAPGYAPRKHFGYSFAMIRKNEKVGGRPFFENVDMRPGQEVSGLVETPEGKPAAGVKVQAYSVTSKRAKNTFEYGSFADTLTDAQGRFKLTLVTPGDAVFWLLPKDYAPSLHVVKPEKRGDLGRFGLQAGLVLKGKVLDTQGKPLAGVYVTARREDRDEVLQSLIVADSIGRTATTNDKGEFAMMPLPPGTYRVMPDEHNSEPSNETYRRERRPLTEVFSPRKVKLEEGQNPDPLVVRASPSVQIEAQYYDSKGKPTTGHDSTVWGQIDGGFWHTMAKADAKGHFLIRAPHGLENAHMDLMTNEHGVLRWRKGKDGELHNSRGVDLGTLDKDVKDIEIVRYVAPIVIVKLTAKDGGKLKDPAVTAVYPEGKGQFQGRLILKNGLNSDVSFEDQEDGRFRSFQLLPDQEVTFTGHAEGYRESSTKLKLPEGTTKEIEIVLEKK